MGVNAETQASAQTFADRADPYVEAARLRDELAQTQQMLDDAQRLTKTGHWIIDPIGGGATGSVECYRILGLPGKTSSAHFMECLSNVHPDDLPAVLEGFQQSVATGEPRPLHYRIVAGDSSTTDIETVAQPVRDETGRVVSVVGTVMDVTERNRVQEALRASEKLARGQLGALTRTLDALVQEASPDRLLEVVLRTISRQFDAATITVWLTDEGSECAAFNFQFLDDRLFSVADARHPAARMSCEAQDNPVWRRILATKRPEICEDLRSDTSAPFREYNLSLGIVTILVVPMLIAGEVAGLLAISFRERRDLRSEEIELAQALANQAMLALQLTRLSDYSRNAAVMAERNRVVRDVHDTLAHAFTGVIVQLEAADDAASRGLGAEAGAHIARAEAMARGGLQEARRSVMALRPQVLEGNDLSSALREMVTGMTDGTSVNSEFAQGGVPRQLPPEWDEHLLRIGQETLTNAIRHGHAQRIVLELDFSDDAVKLSLTDDGRGFDANSAFDGLGLAGIRARVSSMGGQLSIRSAAGSGTTILVSIPQRTATESVSVPQRTATAS
jgi:signal transduction histidine kinase